MRPFDITDPLPTGTTLLEASAGTGKTWTIAALVTRYVAEGHVRLEEMLVVTFGRAASQELRERVREQLVEAERALAGGRAEGALLELLLDGTAEELAARRRRIREALVAFDSATIATTHQFCQMVLKSLGVAGDTDAGAHLVEDLDDLLVEVVDDLYVRGFSNDLEKPVFSRAEALTIARRASNDPQARLEPTAAPDDTTAGRRRRFADAVRVELDQRKRRLGVLSYDDLLSQLADALKGEDAPARERMRARWKVVLVDEFQDTDPVQWQVLDRAFSGHAAMVLIGDPKQAIYAFRGGDVVTYLSAAATATAHATLDTNHRSDAPLLDSMQAVLRGAALGDSEIVVRDVAAHHQEPRLIGAPHPAPFRLRMVERERFRRSGTDGVAIGALREHVAKDLAMDVRALLASKPTFEGRGLEPRDIAVLCATRRQCAVAWQALADQGIPAVISGGGSVFATEGAAAWLTLLEALEQPHRTSRVRAAGLTSFFGHSAADLDAGGDVLTDRLADTLRDWADLFRQRGVAAVFEVALTTHDVLARVLSRVDGERLTTDLRHAAEALHDVALRERLGLVALVTWLRAQMAEDKLAVASERTRRLDSDAAAVQILTIHGSKGLQYPVVYLPSICDLYPQTPAVPLFHADDGQRCIDVGGRDAASDHVRRAADEDAGEDLRLLYVAMTRAQCQLVTWWLPSAKNTTHSALHRMLFGRAPGVADVPTTAPLGDDEFALEIAQRWQSVGGPSVEAADWGLAALPALESESADLSVREFTRAVDTTWRRTSYSALSSAAAALSGPEAQPAVSVGSEPEDPPRDDEGNLDFARSAGDLAGSAGAGDAVVSPMATLPVGATFGSLVHAVLEHADPAAPERGGDLRAELLHHVREQLVRWPVELDAEELADALVAVCDTPLGPLAGATLHELGRPMRMCELDFELPLAGGDDRDYAGREQGDGTLRDIAAILRRHLPEGDPLLPYAEVVDDPAYSAEELRGYLTGSVDVVLRVGEPSRFVIVDYKTNWLGPFDPEQPLTSDAYRPEALAEAMNHSSYPLQALLYAVVLHRFLRWRLSGYDPTQHFGGVLYLYLRGMCGPETPIVDGHPCGVFSWQPPIALVEELSDLLDGSTAVRT